MAHWRRAQWAEALADKLNCPIVWDEIGSAWDTGRRALELADRDASHHLVVQDDAIVCRDLVAGLEQAVTYAGQRPLGLFLRQKPHHRRTALAAKAATQRNRTWIEMHGNAIAGVASVHPVALIDDLLAFDYGRESHSYDSRTSEFYRQLGMSAWYTWPSLVEHQRGKSLMKGHPEGRHAMRFIGEDASALDVDWSRPPQIAPP